MLTFVTIPCATAISELVGKTFAAEEAGSIFPKSTTLGALPSHLTDRVGKWKKEQIVNGL